MLRATSRKAAVGSARIADYAEPDKVSLKQRDGRYSSVQSINSEDTVTWAAFGLRVPDVAIAAVLDEAFGRSDRPTGWQRRLWEKHRTRTEVAAGRRQMLCYSPMVGATPSKRSG